MQINIGDFILTASFLQRKLGQAEISLCLWHSIFHRLSSYLRGFACGGRIFASGIKIFDTPRQSKGTGAIHDAHHAGIKAKEPASGVLHWKTHCVIGGRSPLFSFYLPLKPCRMQRLTPSCPATVEKERKTASHRWLFCSTCLAGQSIFIFENIHSPWGAWIFLCGR